MTKGWEIFANNKKTEGKRFLDKVLFDKIKENDLGVYIAFENFWREFGGFYYKEFIKSFATIEKEQPNRPLEQRIAMAIMESKIPIMVSALPDACKIYIEEASGEIHEDILPDVELSAINIAKAAFDLTMNQIERRFGITAKN